MLYKDTVSHLGVHQQHLEGAIKREREGELLKERPEGVCGKMASCWCLNAFIVAYS